MLTTATGGSDLYGIPITLTADVLVSQATIGHGQATREYPFSR